MDTAVKPKLKQCELPGCTNEFEPHATGTCREKRFCCRAHLSRWHILETSRQRAEEREAQKKTTVPLPCARDDCQNTFIPKRFHADGTPAQEFCSRRCKEIVENLRRRKDSREKPMPPMEEEPPAAGSAPTEDLISEVQSRGFFVTKKPQRIGEHFKVDMSMFEGNTVRFAVISDTHLCSKQQQLSHLRSFYRMCSEREIGLVLHCGDIGEGNGKVYSGQIFDIFVHGADAQRDYIVEHYPREPGITTHFILGNHDYSFYRGGGFDIGEAIADKRVDMKYLGIDDAYVQVAKNVQVNLHHPDGGTAYALSYNAQKKVEAYPPELKPRLAFYGHYHRTVWLPSYRNCDTFLAACFQSQTNFLKRKKIFPIIGGWIIEAVVNKDGLARIVPEFVRFYVPNEDDY